MNKKGFTLIELLAVIIILGILMIIAIPSVTSYINNSRKSAYVDTAKEIISGARNVVNDGKLEMYSTDTTYYIPSSYIKTENASKSPYGDFVYAYVGVIYDGTGYKYYWISVDETKQGVKDIVAYDQLDEDDIVSDVDKDAVNTTVHTTGIGNRQYIKILKPDGTWETPIYLDDTSNNVSEEGGSPSGSGSGGGTTPPEDVVDYMGKTKGTVDVGDLVKIGTEEFYVIKPLTNGELTLLAHYNLNVGTKPYGTETGIQSPNVLGMIDNDYYSAYGNGVFSHTNYWINQVGEGLKYDGEYVSPNYPYVYDENSEIFHYLDYYQDYLNSILNRTITVRLLKYSEAVNLGCSQINHSCNDAPLFVNATSYWLGSAADNYYIWYVRNNNTRSFGNDHHSAGGGIYGIRPVIVI